MDADKLPPPADGRFPADLTKKELVAHLVAAAAMPRWKLNVMTREAIVALFDLSAAEALATVDAAGKAHSRKYRQQTAVVRQSEAAVFAREQDNGEETAVYEYLSTGRVKR